MLVIDLDSDTSTPNPPALRVVARRAEALTRDARRQCRPVACSALTCLRQAIIPRRFAVTKRGA